MWSWPISTSVIAGFERHVHGAKVGGGVDAVDLQQVAGMKIVHHH